MTIPTNRFNDGGLSRRRLAFALTLVAAGIPLSALAQEFPSRPIKMVVPYTAGGTADTLGRLMASGMTTALGESVIVENRSGAGAVIGATYVAKSPPDGYTLLLGAGSTHTTPQAVMKTLPYDPLKDFEPLAMIGTTAYVMMVNPKLPFQDLPGLIAYAKANPGKLSYGSTGNGAAVHLAMAHFEQLAGIKMLHVPYRGGGQILVDLMGGQIDIGLGTAESAGTVNSGKLRAVTILGPNRLSAMPTVPTCIESGVPKCEFPVWNAVFAPAGTPEPVMAKLKAAAAQTLALPATRKSLRDLGYAEDAAGPGALRQRISDEIRLVKATADSAGVKPE